MDLESLIKKYRFAAKAASKKSTIIALDQKTQALTQKDVGRWRMAWQRAINVDNPSYLELYSIYTDTLIDNHLTGAIGQRKGMTLKKGFKVIDRNRKENPDLTKIFLSGWFHQFINLALDSKFWGHSLIQLGDMEDVDGTMRYKNVLLVPRQHVIPSKGVIIRSQTDSWDQGVSYRDTELAEWCVEAGEEDNLGLLLKVAPHAISKRYMSAYWDQFGELFGMPLRVVKTTTRDEQERNRIYSMLRDMAHKAFGIFPEGTDIQFIESSKGDAYNVYDKRIDRCDSEMSKAILGQTMTLENGSSKAQGEVHLTVLEDMVKEDGVFIRNLVNDKLIPLMLSHGFKLSGYTWEWDDTLQLTPEQQQNMEKMLLSNYEIDPQYFIAKYNIPITGKKQASFAAKKSGFLF